MPQLEYSENHSQVYVIFSVDTEHDITRKYTTLSAGWSKGIPLLFEVFDASGLRSKVCWLIEYNLKDGLVAANPNSVFYANEFPELIEQIQSRGDELGLHPTMVDWLGTEKQVPASAYNEPALWDTTKRLNDPEFVINLITSAKKEFTKACGVDPLGCRTGQMLYATHLATALARSGIHIDSSVSKSLRLKPWVLKAPNAYYAAGDDIRHAAATETGVLEIPTTGYIQDSQLLNLRIRLRSWYWLHRRRPIFLSFFIHNWQAIASDGRPDWHFLDILFLTLRFLGSNGAHFLSWTEAKNVYENIYGNGLRF